MSILWIKYSGCSSWLFGISCKKYNNNNKSNNNLYLQGHNHDYAHGPDETLVFLVKTNGSCVSRSISQKI